MSKWVLRATGGSFLGSALLVAKAQYDSSNRLTSVERSLSLQRNQVTSVAFTPAVEDALYLINLKFEKSQRKSLNCQAIQSSNLQWSLIRGNSPIRSSDLRDSTVKCRETDTAVIFDLPVPEHLLNQQHFLTLVAADQQPGVVLKTDLSITPFGIAVHYAFMDLAVLELALATLFIVGLSCFLPDLYQIFFRRKSKQQLHDVLRSQANYWSVGSRDFWGGLRSNVKIV